nr:ribonuclease H-like domain-containing protein [Tanacetum cinerariifolium]
SPKDTRNKDTQRRNVPVETSTANALVSHCDGVGSYDWSFQADEEPTNYALMAFTSSSSSSSDNKVFNSTLFDCDELHSYESDVSVPTSPVYDSETVSTVFNVEPSTTKPTKEMSPSNRPSAPIIKDWVSDSEDEFEVEHPTQAENLKENIPKSRIHRHSWNRKAYFVCKSVNHLIKNCDYFKKQMVQKPVWNHAMRINHQKSARMTHPSSNKHVVPTVVLTRSRLIPLNVVRLVTTVVPQTNVKHQRPVKHVVNKPHSPIIRPINHRPTAKNSNFHLKVNTVKPKKVNVVHETKGNWVWKPKCTVLDHVSRLTKLKFNLFSVSQMCDKKNNVLFTDTECVVLSSDFKLSDENHVLLRVSRKNNMYNVDPKKIVP